MDLPDEEYLAERREQMVRFQIEDRGVTDPLVLSAMRKVPRHKFVPAHLLENAYNDYPLPIGFGQTISQPYIVGYMTEQLRLSGGEKVLEIGTGSGYQTAVLAEIAGAVYTIDIICELVDAAARRLEELDYKNVFLKCADGHQGWPQHAPFDGIIVTAAPGAVPKPLKDQLKPGARMLVPVGELSQELILVKKRPDGRVEEEPILPVRFVPMRSEREKRP